MIKCFLSTIEEYKVERTCRADGTWADPVYEQCIEVIKNHPQCIVGFCKTVNVNVFKKLPKSHFKKIMYYVYSDGYLYI